MDISIQQKIRNLLANLPPALALVWRAAPRWTLIWGVLSVLQGILPVAVVYLTRDVVESLSFAVNTTAQEDILLALRDVGLVGGVLLLQEALGSVQGWVQMGQSEQVQDAIKGMIHDQANTLDLSYYESPTYYDMLHQASNDAASRPLALVKNMGTLGQNGITLVAMVGVLLPFGLWLPMALLVSTMPAFYILLRFNRHQHQWQLSNTADIRRTYYYDWMLTGRESVPEIRLFGLGNHFKTAYQTLRHRLRGERVDLAKRQGFANLIASGLGLLTMGVALAWTTWQTAQTGGSLGDLALFYQAFNQGQSLTRTLLSNVGQIHGNLLFLQNLFAFLDLKPRLTETDNPKPARLQSSIDFQNVTFRYPETERPALADFSLTIPAGKIVAIVGENGAGKSTLIKLLCRFFDPDQGAVKLDGVDIREMALPALHRLFTVLFQEPLHFHQTAGENIAIGDWFAHPTPTAIEAAAIAAGADDPIGKLPDGYETILGKWFGGSELSVGEWQRVALARAFLRQADIIILDEPTSAMDSWAEAAWLTKFRDLVAGRTAIIITHRFTTAMQADVIHVMVGGKIVESGSHVELLSQNGRYANSWRQQWRMA